MKKSILAILIAAIPSWCCLEAQSLLLLHNK